MTVTDELGGIKAVTGLGPAPGSGGTFWGAAPGRPGIAGKATGALLTGAAAGAEATATGAEIGEAGVIVDTTAGGATGAITGLLTVGSEAAGAALMNRGGNAGGALGALAITWGIATVGGAEFGRGGNGAGAFETGLGGTTGAAGGTITGAGAGFEAAAALATATASFSRAISCVLFTKTPAGMLTREGSLTAATCAAGAGAGLETTAATTGFNPNSFSISSK